MEMWLGARLVDLESGGLDLRHTTDTSLTCL